MPARNGFFNKSLMLMLALWIGGDVFGAQCSDGLDNDADGEVDMASPYCKLEDDNDESSFGSGVPGDDGNLPRSLDTFFDLNGGNGDDSCNLHACCMIPGACPADLEPGFFNSSLCTATTPCIDNTKPLVQPGCDAFGCCLMHDAATSTDQIVFINPVVSPNCTLATIGDEASCRPCLPNPETYLSIDLFIDGFE
jgi:hypothetical protein